MTSPNPRQTLVSCYKVRGKEVTIKIHQCLQEAGACAHPSLTLDPQASPASIWLIVLLPLCDASFICSVLVLQKWKNPWFPLGTLCSSGLSHECGKSVRSMQKTERKKKAETRKIIPRFCCSWLLCLLCSLWEGSNDPTAKVGQDLSQAGVLNVSPD